MILVKIDRTTVRKNPDYNPTEIKTFIGNTGTFHVIGPPRLFNNMQIMYDGWVKGENYTFTSWHEGVRNGSLVNTGSGVFIGEDLINKYLLGETWEGVDVSILPQYHVQKIDTRMYLYEHEPTILPDRITCPHCNSIYDKEHIGYYEYDNACEQHFIDNACRICEETIIEYEVFKPEEHAKGI